MTDFTTASDYGAPHVLSKKFQNVSLDFPKSHSKPILKTKYSNTSASPQVKRKEFKIESSDDEDFCSQINKTQRKSESNAFIYQGGISLEKNLHDELILLCKSKKNKEKIITLIEETFKYRRNIIENSNSDFLDLIDKFYYLSDIKNVSIQVY